MQPLCYHICFVLRIILAGRHRNESKLFCCPKWVFFNVLCHMLYCWTNHSQEVCVGVLLMPMYCCCWHVNTFYLGGEISVSSYLTPKIGTLEVANMPNFCSGEYIYIYIYIYIKYQTCDVSFPNMHLEVNTVTNCPNRWWYMENSIFFFWWHFHH